MQLSEQDVPSADWRAAATALHAEGATMLDFLTAVDHPDTGEIELVVHLVDVPGRSRHLLRTRIPRERPDADTLIEVLPGAAWHEREVHEMFGVRFLGNPDLRPLLTDGSAPAPPLLRTTALPRRLGTSWPGAVDPADRPAARPQADARPAAGQRSATPGKVAARPRSRLGPPGIPAEWGSPPPASAAEDSP